MNGPNHIYIVDDDPNNTGNAITILTTGWLAAVDRELAAQRLSSQEAILFKTLQLPTPEPLLDGMINADKLRSITASLANSSADSALLFQDFNLLGNSANDRNKVNARDILKAFSPSRRRVAAYCTQHGDADPIFTDTLKTTEKPSFLVKGYSLGGEYAERGICAGIKRWLGLNRQLYDRFVEDLIALDHKQNEQGHDKLDLFKEAAANTIIPAAAENDIKKLLHQLANGRIVDFRAPWLLALIAFKELFPDADASSLFPWGSFMASAPPAGTCCLPVQIPAITERKSVLLLFGELCRKLFINDANQTCALTQLLLGNNSFTLHLDYLPKRVHAASGMADNIEAGIGVLRHTWSAAALSHLKEVCQAGKPTAVHHETTDLLVACWLAFQHATSGREDGQDFFGGARISVRELLGTDNRTVGTEVSFHE